MTWKISPNQIVLLGETLTHAKVLMCESLPLGDGTMFVTLYV